MHTMHQRPTSPGNERGAMLIEILVALLILLVIMVGVMQLFAAALVSDRGSQARTELSYRAQQTIEVIRMANAIVRSAGGTVPEALKASKTGITFPITAKIDPTELPSGPSDEYWDFWGPNGTGVGVIDSENPRYVIKYEVVDGDLNGSPGAWLLRVVAYPRSRAAYLTENKVVRYVAAIPK